MKEKNELREFVALVVVLLVLDVSLWLLLNN